MTFETTVLGLDPHLVDYLEGLEHQRRVFDAVSAGTRPDTLLLLEHAAVYTAGKRTEPHERPAEGDGTPVIDVDRGGKITWHGPGQLVGYPIRRLADPKDVRLYVHQLEAALIEVLADLGIESGRIEGRSGVWLAGEGAAPARKVGAIGIRVHEGVTMHGFALNCSNDLGPYERIVPCGIADAGVTTISQELGRTVTPEALAAPVEAALRKHVTA